IEGSSVVIEFFADHLSQRIVKFSSDRVQPKYIRLCQSIFDLNRCIMFPILDKIIRAGIERNFVSEQADECWKDHFFCRPNSCLPCNSLHQMVFFKELHEVTNCRKGEYG